MPAMVASVRVFLSLSAGGVFGRMVGLSWGALAFVRLLPEASSQTTLRTGEVLASLPALVCLRRSRRGSLFHLTGMRAFEGRTRQTVPRRFRRPENLPGTVTLSGFLL